MAPPAASQGQGTSKPKHSPPGDLTKFITKHESDRIVDSGGHASIYRCTYMPREGQPVEVAVKVLHQRPDTEDEALWREIGIWKRMRHECIVPLLGTTTHYSPVSFVSPWMPNGTLNFYLKKVSRSLTVKYSLLYDVADGLHYCRRYMLTLLTNADFLPF
ncbi:kinase-like protein [Rhizopogon salebrosus TDB-379]|nr:kinase-like protein [Rhizopogon salebrosus TDB-379]